MSLITLEHGRTAYALDFLAIAAAGTGLGAIALVAGGETGASPGWTVALALGGLLAWTLIEYTLHRFVLHGLQPFRRWHTLHHQRPGARIYAPTWLSGSLVVVGVLLPLWLYVDLHVAAAVGFGVVAGNMAYSVTHHVAHHSPLRTSAATGDGSKASIWHRRVHEWHGLHHGTSRATAQFGVSTRLWDCVFGTERARPLRRRYRPAS
jgi:cyclopropane-fatty-acyl-phospholipid synthase